MRSKEPCMFCDPEGAAPIVYGALTKQNDFSRTIIGYIGYIFYQDDEPYFVHECEGNSDAVPIKFCPECGRDLNA